MPDIRSVDRKICTGCAACVNLCPKGAIFMRENCEGFLYPEIEEEKCIHCGICYQRCPTIYPKHENNADPDCYAVQGKDKLRKESSSGGVFSILADYILSRNGYVCGAEYTENKIAVRHEIISHRSDLPRLRGSKYIQSEIGTVYKQLKEKLLTGAPVLFVGCPCQVAGLKSFLGKEYNVERYRTLGHIAERLVNVYVRFLRDTRKDLKILSLPTVVFSNTKNTAKLNRVATLKKCYAAVALACDDKYMPYTGALLQSIIENAGQDAFYDIVVMHNSISENNQRICKELAKGHDNISIRFLDVSRNFAAYAAVHVDRHLTVETYFRFMIPDLFKEYDKVLYLDCDMVVNEDIAKLFKLDIGDNYVAATRDLDFIASCEEPGRGEFYEEKILKYIKIDAVENYFQAGAILFNIREILKKYDTKKLFAVALSRNWYYHDQDVLNHLFNGKVTYLEQRWNILSLLESGSHRSKLFKEYLYAKYNEMYHAGRKNPAIIHYAGVPKPWKDLKCDLADYFWKYARTSPYYEQLLLISNESSSLPNGSLVFYGHNNAADNVGAPLFTVKCNANEWTSCYINVEFMHLTDNDIPCSASRLLMTSRVVPSGGGFVNKVSQFMFENTNGAEFFRNNIGYTVNADKTITIWARYANIFEGFAWRVLLVESRDLEKPSIIPEEQGILYTARPLPRNVLYSK